jgi:1-deoxy-D-xylulose-5-phosphate reductoisomerase
MTASANRPQRLVILGSTGSVGTTTLDVVSLHRESFEVFALSGFQRMDVLAAQCRQWQPRHAVVPTPARAAELRERLAGQAAGTEILVGEQALCDVASAAGVDSVMAAIVGAAGLRSCMAAARAGKRLLLANKEALVVGGGLFMQAVAEGGGTLIPIDSEHSAIFQCLPLDRAAWPAFIDHIVLTASGGPFRQRDPASFGDITPAQAVAHPNWVMGRKISVDSATMMNKALEVIEAHWLFGLAPDRIRVVIHPQSIVHSMVVCRDASVLAQLGTPDMRVPVAVGLSFPERVPSGAARLDFLAMPALSFEPLDPRRFPGLQLAYDALAGPPGSTAVLNAANEAAVAAFLDGGLRYTAIHEVNARTVDALAARLGPVSSIDELIALDARARAHAAAVVKELAR